MTVGSARSLATAFVCGLVLVGLPVWAAAQPPTSTESPAQKPGEAKTMTEGQQAKLDAFLKQAVANKRQELLGVIIRPGTEEGAAARVGEVLTKLGLKVTRTLSGGTLLLVTLKAEQLPDVVASADVAHVSFDAYVTPQKK